MADFNYITSRGVIVPDTADIRDEVIADYRAVFGQDLIVTPETPQGILITQDVEIRDGVARNNAELANQINPDIAGGIWIDAIWSLTGGRRRPATRSILNGVILTGIPSTLVPAGSLATVSTSGAQFALASSVVIGPGGTATGTFVAVDTGPIGVAPGGLDSVASSVLGWETVTNPTSAVVGANVESDEASRKRRRNTLALQAISLGEAITSRLYAIDGVRSLTFRENVTNFPAVIDGINLVEKSIWVCVDGGTDAEIAQALLDTKTVGAAWNGSVVVNVTEQYSGQVYEVKFDRPTEIIRFVRVTIRDTTLPAQTIIPQAIADYAAGELPGETGLTVGTDISPFELAGAVSIVEPRIFVTKVETSTDGVTWSTADVPVALDEVARISASAVTVVVA